MRKRFLLTFCISFLFYVFFISFSAFAQENETNGYMFRLFLKNKGNSPFSIDNPQAFLSQKSIDRRARQEIAIDSTDLPLDPDYLVQIKSKGAVIRASSKWLNTVTVYVPDSTLVGQLKTLPFVSSATFVWKGMLQSSNLKSDWSSTAPNNDQTPEVNYYGEAYAQIHLHRGDMLHDAGFQGEGMTIAVIDGGFGSANNNDVFNQSQILGMKNFTHQLTQNIFDSDATHGTKVLSCMITQKPGVMVGTAPHANYYLLQTEVIGEEFPVEEDYWAAGIEYADSLGVDIVTSSLGYARFDNPDMNHTQKQLDGKTVPISRAASLASDKGMLVFIAAGNEGSNDWKKICFPADAKGIIAVGSVTKTSDNKVSVFSSIGLSADGRIKPDLMAVGSNTALMTGTGEQTSGSGTSYATPVLAGLGACLWQSLPYLTNKQIIQLLEEDANRYTNPDSIYGYGIPDVYKAYSDKATALPVIEKEQHFLQQDPNTGRLFINLSPDDYRDCHLTIFSTLGYRVLERTSLTESIDINFLPQGIYIASLSIGHKRYVQKFIK